MKSKIKWINLLSIQLIVLLFTACSKEPESTLTGEVKEVFSDRIAQWTPKETEDENGSSEDPSDPEAEKEETNSDDEDLVTEIQSLLDAATGNPVSNCTDCFVGVLATSAGCGSYVTLQIGIDDENHRNSSNATGWNGISGVVSTLDPYFPNNHLDDGRWLSFCIVPSTYFGSMNNMDFAVLQFSYDFPDGVSQIALFEDCEDPDILSKNQNWIYDSNNPIYSYYLSPVGYNNPVNYPDVVYGPNHFDHNIALNFLYYPMDASSSVSSFSNIPGLGKNYGVFGTSGVSGFDGEIFIDDEDRRNVNQIGVRLYDPVTSSYPSTFTFGGSSGGGVAGVIVQHPANTNYYTCKAQ